MSFNIDAKLENADWAKRTWDLPTTLQEFKDQTLDQSTLKPMFRKLMTLPVGRAMPKGLIADLRKEYGQHFVPQYIDANLKLEKKDVYEGGDSVLHPKPQLLKPVLKGQRKRSLRKKRVINFKKPDDKK